jgi:hypothetical protein
MVQHLARLDHLRRSSRVGTMQQLHARID